MDGSTNSSVVEQKVYIFFLDKGVPKVKFFRIEIVQLANAEVLLVFRRVI